MDQSFKLRVTLLLHLRGDFAIHQKGTMGLLSHVWLHGMKKSAASDFSCSSDHGDGDLLHHGLEPANVVSEDVALASTWCEIVDDNVRLVRDRTFCSDAASRVK